MNDLSWTPADIGRLTLAQLVCLTSEKPPVRARAAEWSSGPEDADRGDGLVSTR